MDLDIGEMEKRVAEKWDSIKLYKFSKNNLPLYTIDVPPPTISGELHMGHAFSYPHQDFLARYKRMRGFNVYYHLGFDDNGLPTERYTEKRTGKKGSSLPLRDFISNCLEISSQAEEKMSSLFRRLGLSMDFSDYYRTISPETQKISQRRFIELAKKGDAYRTEGPTLRCPACGTAISQIDLKDVSLKTDFVYVKFSGEFGDIIIATTRPEMMGACVAICVNPEDERFREYIGKKVTVPEYGYQVSIISDDYVRKDVGTGAEMICTFGDQNDVALWRKHGLETRIIMDAHGIMNHLSGPLEGMNIRDARKHMIDLLSSSGKVVKTERIEHTVNVHERCDTPIEIGIEKQWFIRCLNSVPQLLEMGSRISWFPEYMKIRYNNWVNGLKWDWCISRQRFYGIPFPVWICEDCGAIQFATDDELPVDPRLSSDGKICQNCGSPNIKGESDVMDTWATSSLTPEITLAHHDLQDNFPMDIRVQAHDIINTWTFTTILRSFLHHGDIPWKSILLSGLVHDPSGAKMSKSRGNISAPEYFIQTYGADSLRLWAASGLTWDDIKLKEQELVRGRRTVIKLYNAGKLISMLSSNHDYTGRPETSSIPSKWILSKLHRTLGTVEEMYDSMAFSKGRSELDNFFWNTFCDFYLEILKTEIKDGNLSEINTALFVFHKILLMYAPIIPFITDDIYDNLPAGHIKESIHLESWPDRSAIPKFPEESKMDYVINAVSSIRSAISSLKEKSQKDGEKLSIILHGDKEVLSPFSKLIQQLCRVEISEVKDGEEIGVDIAT